MRKIEINWSKLVSLSPDSFDVLGSESGVYRLSKKGDDGKYYVFFVGSADNLKEKLLFHLSDNETNSNLKKFLSQGGDFAFRYAIVADKNIREAIEKQMYKHYIPEYNPEEPKSSLDIEVNMN